MRRSAASKQALTISNPFFSGASPANSARTSATSIAARGVSL